jgi:hypothetical protein
MQIKEVSIAKVHSNRKHNYNPGEVDEIMKKVNLLEDGRAIELIEKNKVKRDRLYWKLYSFIYNRRHEGCTAKVKGGGKKRPTVIFVYNQTLGGR